jgi:photosystem II stability/assembly factor-like uncharacterized protein
MNQGRRIMAKMQKLTRAKSCKSELRNMTNKVNDQSAGRNIRWQIRVMSLVVIALTLVFLSDQSIGFDTNPSKHSQGNMLTFAQGFDGNGIFDASKEVLTNRSFEEPGTRLVGGTVSEFGANTDTRSTLEPTLEHIGNLTTQYIVVTDSGTKPERTLWHVTPEGEVTVIRDDAPIPGNLGGFQLDLNGDIVVAASGMGLGNSVVQRFSADGTLIRTIQQQQVEDMIGREILRFGDMVIDGRGDLIVLTSPASEDGIIPTPMLLRIAPDGSQASVILDAITDHPNWSLDMSAVAIDPVGRIIVSGAAGFVESGNASAVLAVAPHDGSVEMVIPPRFWIRPDGIRESIELTFNGERLQQSLAGFMSDGGIAIDAQGNYIMGMGQSATTDLGLYRVPMPPEFIVLDFNEDTNRLWSGMEVFPLHFRDPETLRLYFRDIAVDQGGDTLLAGHDAVQGTRGVWRVTPEGVAFLLADMTDFMDGQAVPARLGIVPKASETPPMPPDDWVAVEDLFGIVFSAVAVDESNAIAGLAGTNGAMIYAAGNGIDLFADCLAEEKVEGCDIYKSADGGETWSSITGSVERLDARALAVHGPNLYAATITSFAADDPEKILRSSDDGNSWEVVAEGEDLGKTKKALAIDPGDPNTIYAGSFEFPDFDFSEDALVIKSTDGGETWSHLAAFVEEIIADVIQVHPLTGEVFVGGSGVPLVKSADGGNTWNEILVPNLDPFFVTALALHPDDPGTLYLGAQEHGVFKSTDGGLTWEPKNNGLPLEVFDINVLLMDPAQPDTLYAGTNAGFFLTQDGGDSWTAHNEGLPDESARWINDLAFTPEQRLIAGTNGGLFLLDLSTGPDPAPEQRLYLPLVMR